MRGLKTRKNIYVGGTDKQHGQSREGHIVRCPRMSLGRRQAQLTKGLLITEQWARPSLGRQKARTY